MLLKRSGFAVACLALIALGSSAIRQEGPKPFDERTEVPATRKLIEAKYAGLSDAIFNSDPEKSDDFIHEDFELYDSFTGKPTDEYSDESDYLDDIESNSAVLSPQKANMEGLGATLKIERKVTQFLAGRRLATAIYTESATGEMLDAEGQFGGKGKKIKVETRGTFTDQWRFDESDDRDGHDWYLIAREATSFSMKINGKDIPIESGKSD